MFIEPGIILEPLIVFPVALSIKIQLDVPFSFLQEPPRTSRHVSLRSPSIMCSMFVSLGMSSSYHVQHLFSGSIWSRWVTSSVAMDVVVSASSVDLMPYRLTPVTIRA